MTRKRSQLQAYFAGLFDGEGCVDINREGNSLRVTIGMTDPQAIGLLSKEYPEARVYLRPNDGKPWRPCYVLNINQHKAYNFLRDVEPFCVVKLEQVKVALAYLAHRRRDHYPARQLIPRQGCISLDCHGRCDRLLNRLQDLKRVDYQGVKTVNLGELREYRAKPEDVAEDTSYINDMLSRLWEGVETRGAAATANKPNSAPEKDIVQV